MNNSEFEKKTYPKVENAERIKEPNVIFSSFIDRSIDSSIVEVIDYFKNKQLPGKPRLSTGELEKRLTEISNGRKVPVVIFNCLEFSWQKDDGKYPKSIILDEFKTSNGVYFKETILDSMKQLQSLGEIKFSIIIPDSELFDPRPFSFSQDEKARQAIAETVLSGLSENFSDTQAEVLFWSDFCRKQNLMSPLDYTSDNFKMIVNDLELRKKVKIQINDSKNYFQKSGLDPEYIANIPEADLEEKIAWYLAMYSGEGQALADCGAIVINLEDMRVPKWFQIGAKGSLPILTPVNPTDWYGWRKTLKELKSINDE